MLLCPVKLIQSLLEVSDLSARLSEITSKANYNQRVQDRVCNVELVQQIGDG